MIKNFNKHIRYYVAFIFVQLLGLILIVLSAGNRQLQFGAILATTIFYFVFAITHHMLDHDLNSKIVLEYALMGCLGLTVSLYLFNI
jgi:hypothetical protein